MKALIALAMLVSASSAFATRPDDFSVSVLSYCDANQVIAENSNGQAVVKDDCAAQGLTCKTYQFFQQDINQTTFVAKCEAAQ